MDRPEHWPRVEDKLRLFKMCVAQKKPPPEWLLEFMAEGAQEFLRGGKAWHRPTGRRRASFGNIELVAHLLHQEGGLSADEVVQALGEGDEGGKDRSRTIRRMIERGGVVADFLAPSGALRMVLAALSVSDLSALTDARAERCRERLREAQMRLEADEIEPGYE